LPSEVGFLVSFLVAPVFWLLLLPELAFPYLAPYSILYGFLFFFLQYADATAFFDATA
jgi:hypothetical protein